MKYLRKSIFISEDTVQLLPGKKLVLKFNISFVDCKRAIHYFLSMVINHFLFLKCFV